MTAILLARIPSPSINLSVEEALSVFGGSKIKVPFEMAHKVAPTIIAHHHLFDTERGTSVSIRSLTAFLAILGGGE